jgi:uncharacterized membrane protein YozB (DUF420 family)
VNAKLVFWTVALANLALIVACGARGVRAIRRGEVRTHRRMMLTATALVGLFLASYAAKVAVLGKEDRSGWTALDHAILGIHELCIAAMLVAGGYALFRAWRFQPALRPDWVLPPGADALPGRARHRRAGAIAKWSGVFAFVTAIGVWAGMLLRAGD